MVKNVYIGSPADLAGIDKDDILLKLNGDPIMSLELFVKTMRNSEVGSEVRLEVMHNGELKRLL